MVARIVSFRKPKPALFFAVLCAGLQWTCAQPAAPGKLVFEETVKADSLPKDSLHQNAKRWLASRPFAVATDSASDGTWLLASNAQFPVYAAGYVSKKLSGMVHCALRIETKDGRYRYRFGGFVFHYYKEDRNYKIVPTGKTKPLEEKTASGWQKTWDAHQRTVQTTMARWTADLKTEIVRQTTPQPKAAPPPEKW